MRFSSALITFIPSLSTASVAIKNPHDSVLHDETASILEESIEVKYKNKKSHLEPLKIQNSIDGRPHKANDVVDLADDKSLWNLCFMLHLSFNQPIDSWDVSQVERMEFMFNGATSFNQPIDSWDVSKVEDMDSMFGGAIHFNQCLSTWAEKTSDTVDTTRMLSATKCPNGINSPNATIGPWCQDNTQECFAPGFEPSQQPSNKPTDVPTKPPTNAPTNVSNTKSQKKKSTKRTKKQVKKKSKKM
ncbi:hypothetical protein FRACYDRAFT_246180 [Fragilariopsis cylindrus CCMP1102]|uniref:DUF285-domain-containing protein n=1 Tax=Fragilariopsis cylindrus CCMP1102 TaxID=635003 RepID=A0A1E7EZ26_9STRA|nr:hypothetical protein FRACYDRAFT_246180 [Fragilariopsis cylindrus CCMP1102]|eukprot:OEU11076.1 hypothetical protein FRACYDRAFT_246180 [Fragilariopsis cylindrus CCMP1102]